TQSSAAAPRGLRRQPAELPAETDLPIKYRVGLAAIAGIQRDQGTDVAIQTQLRHQIQSAFQLAVECRAARLEIVRGDIETRRKVPPISSCVQLCIGCIGMAGVVVPIARVTRMDDPGVKRDT